MKVTHRNFIGALLGGIIGILAWWYIHPTTLPLGCILGVLLGWWHREILKIATTSANRTLAGLSVAKISVGAFFGTPIKPVDFQPFLRFLSAPIRAVVWAAKTPARFVGWFHAYPKNQVLTLWLLAGAIFTLLTAAWLLPLMAWRMWRVSSDHRGFYGALVIYGGMWLFIIALFPIALQYRESRSANRTQDFIDLGPKRWVGRELADLFRYQASFILYSLGRMVWFGIVGTAFLGLIVVPISFGIAVVKGLYRVSQKSGHWLCLIATVCVTSVVALLGDPYFHEPRILWAAALIAGLASAAVTHAAHRTLGWFFSIQQRAQTLGSAPLWPHLVPSGRLFWEITLMANAKLRSVLPVPIVADLA